MDNDKFRQWVEERNIAVEEDFGMALNRYIKDYKKKRHNKREGDLCHFGRKLAIRI